MKINLLFSYFIVLVIITGKITVAQNYTPEDGWRDAQIYLRSEKSVIARERLNWWRDARFGMFIHWNPSSLVVSEISWSKQFYEDNGENLLDNPRPDPGFPGMKEHLEWLNWFKPAVPGEVYDSLYKSFYPGMFDARKIVSLAKEAGMKYIIIVVKHHDGFCMWDSKFTDYDIMSTPFQRDIFGEFVTAAHNAGIKIGIYYSQRDWHHPDYKPETMEKYNVYMRNQLIELLSNYGEISVLFFDAEEWNTWKFWDGDQLVKMAYQLQPDIIINNRCGVHGDYSTPEQSLGNFNNKRDWESCMTFTGFWSWHGFQTPVISHSECLKYLISCAGGDGNLLMDVGPLPTGQIDPRESTRLKQVGEWMQKYGESIYGTRGGPFLPDSNIVSTHKGNLIFLHVFSQKNSVTLPAIMENVVKAEILYGPEIAFNQEKDKISIALPEESMNNIVTVIKLTMDRGVNSNQISQKQK